MDLSRGVTHYVVLLLSASSAVGCREQAVVEAGASQGSSWGRGHTGGALARIPAAHIYLDVYRMPVSLLGNMDESMLSSSGHWYPMMRHTVSGSFSCLEHLGRTQP